MYLRKQAPASHRGDIVPPAGVTVHNPRCISRPSTTRASSRSSWCRARPWLRACRAEQASGAEIGRIPVDSIYSRCSRSPTSGGDRVEQRTDFDKLILDVETKSSITARDRWRRPQDLVELFGLARELNVEAEGIEIGPSPAEADHIASFALPIDDLDLTVRSYNCLKREV